MESVNYPSDFVKVLADHEAVLACFTAKSCSVCHALKPKLEAMQSESFPKLKMVSVESDEYPELAAYNRVFAAPTVIVFFSGRETIRKSGSFGLAELKSEIQRLYSLCFK